MSLVASFILLAGGTLALILPLGSFQREKMDRFSIGAITLIVLLALAGTGMLGWTPYFPLAAATIALVLLGHHVVVHSSDDFNDEACGCACFQCKDVSNHETWVVAALVAAAVSGLGV